MLKNEAIKTNVEELNLQEVRQALLPTNTLRKEDNFLFFYAMGGDGKIASRKKILREFLNFIPAEGEILRMPIDTQLSIIYFFDADSSGKKSRFQTLLQEIKDVLPSINISIENPFIKVNGIKLGYFIFTGPDNNTGKLEDVILPLMRKSNETVFDNAKIFIDQNHEPARIFPLKMTENGDEMIESRSNKKKHADYQESKSLIGISGQIQRSGKANTVYITDSDYLNLKKIQSDLKCVEIIHFFNEFISR